MGESTNHQKQRLDKSGIILFVSMITGAQEVDLHLGSQLL